METKLSFAFGLKAASSVDCARTCIAAVASAGAARTMKLNRADERNLFVFTSGSPSPVLNGCLLLVEFKRIARSYCTQSLKGNAVVTLGLRISKPIELGSRLQLPRRDCELLDRNSLNR